MFESRGEGEGEGQKELGDRVFHSLDKLLVLGRIPLVCAYETPAIVLDGFSTMSACLRYRKVDLRAWHDAVRRRMVGELICRSLL